MKISLSFILLRHCLRSTILDYFGGFDEVRVCRHGSMPLERVVTRSDRTGNDDFLAFLNDEPELVEEAGTFPSMKNPPHLGRVVRVACLELHSLTVTVAAVTALL